VETVCSERERLLLEARNAVNDHCRLANAAATLTDPRHRKAHKRVAAQAETAFATAVLAWKAYAEHVQQHSCED